MSSPEKIQTLQKVTFFYKESTQHRVVHVDGAFGNVTPQGFIAVSFYSERAASLVEATHKLMDDGRTIDATPFEFTGKMGILRETDVTAVISPETAKNIVQWLLQRIAEAENVINVITQKGEKQ
jgi:hypothetical protein